MMTIGETFKTILQKCSERQVARTEWAGDEWLNEDDQEMKLSSRLIYTRMNNPYYSTT